MMQLRTGHGLPQTIPHIGENEVYLDLETGLLHALQAGELRPLSVGAIPPAPNLIQDSQYFKRLCDGQTNVAMAYDAVDAVQAPWGVASWQVTDFDLTLEVVTVDQFAAKGLDDWGDLRRFLPIPGWSGAGPVFGQVGFHALLVDIAINAVSNGYGEVDFNNPYPGAGAGGYNVKLPSYHMNEALWMTQFGVFINVLDHAGDIEFYVNNMTGGDSVTSGAVDVGQGWQYKHAARRGFGGYLQIYNRCPGVSGTMRYAIALPYASYGNHGGVPIWTNSYAYPDADYDPRPLDLS